MKYFNLGSADELISLSELGSLP